MFAPQIVRDVLLHASRLMAPAGYVSAVLQAASWGAQPAAATSPISPNDAALTGSTAARAAMGDGLLGSLLAHVAVPGEGGGGPGSVAAALYETWVRHLDASCGAMQQV